MQSERDVCIYCAQVLDQTDLPQEMVHLMHRVIDLNPDLNDEERNYLSVAYKNAIQQPRKGLRLLNKYIPIEQDNPEHQNRIQSLIEFKKAMFQELSDTCEEVEELVNTKLLPSASTAEARVFYNKMKADYLRYVCEFIEDEAEKSEVAERTKASYETAIEIAKNEIQPFKPSYLGLLLNYSVFLYEIMEQHEEAIELSRKTYTESHSLVEENSEPSFQEASMILKLLQDNISLWTQ